MSTVLLKRVSDVMADGRWRTGTDVANVLGDTSIPSIHSALFKLVRAGLVESEQPVAHAPTTYRKVGRG